jgi:hypothetical protein
MDGGDSARVEAARCCQEAILAAPESLSRGWVEQARFRDRYDLPPFRPPRFRDDTPVRAVVSALEAEHGVDVMFVERDIGSGWSVEIDGNHAFTVEWRRDGATNVVVPISPGAFRAAVEAVVPK